MAQLLEVPKMTVLDDEGTLAGLPKTGDQNQKINRNPKFGKCNQSRDGKKYADMVQYRLYEVTGSNDKVDLFTPGWRNWEYG